MPDLKAAPGVRAAAHLLLLVLRMRAPSETAQLRRLFAEVDADKLIELAMLHRVSGHVLVAARLNAAPPELMRALELGSRGAVGVHLRVLGELRLLDRVLTDLPWLVVKGPVLAGYAYPRPDLRSYGDLDVLVPPQELAHAVGLLEAAGCIVLDRNWDMFLRDLPGEVHLRTPLGGVLDLHWHLQNDRRARDSASVSTSALVARRRTVQVGGRSVQTLDADDTLLHLCLHAARSGGNRLVWLKDIQQVWWRDRPDATALHERALIWGVELPLVVMLDRARRTLADPQLGADLLAVAGVAAGWRRFSSLIDVLSPVASAGTGSSLSRMVARAVATDPPRAAREGLRRGLFHLQHLRDKGTADATWDPINPESVVFDAGGLPTRQAYFDRVAQQAD